MKGNLRCGVYPALPARQRGAIGLMGALVLGLAVLFMALTVDSGRLMLESRRLQKIADLAALDASRVLCGAATDSLAEVSSAAQASATRNGYPGNLVSEAGVRLGTVTTQAGRREFNPNLGDSLAVQVTTRNRVPASLVAGGIFGQTVTLEAQAVAQEEAAAGLSAGSFLVNIDTRKSIVDGLLGGLLGTSLNLTAVGYRGLADAHLRLLDLIEADAQIGTVNKLLETEMRLADFVVLMAEALSDQPEAPAAAVEALNEVSRAGIDGDLKFKLGDLLKVTTANPEAAAEASLNVLDLLVMSAQVANGKNAVAIPNLNIGIPNVAGISAKLYLIEPPQIAIGPPGCASGATCQDADDPWRTKVKTAQVKLGLHVKLTKLNLGVATAAADLDLYMEAAQTTAWLDSIQCPRATEPNGAVTVGAQPGIARVGIGQLDSAGKAVGPSNVLKVTLLGVPVTVTAQANIPLASDPQSPIVFPGPFPSDSKTVETALSEALTNGLGNLASNLKLKAQVGACGLVCGLLSGLVNTLILNLGGILSPVIQALGGVLTPLLEALGVTLGAADLQVFTLVNAAPQLLR